MNQRLSSLVGGLNGDTPALVAIDGLGGAGKSTVAEELARAVMDVDVVVVHGDDFYGPEERDWSSWTPEQGYERYFDHARLEDQLLRPLKAHRLARFQRYDWSGNKLGDWIEIQPRGIVIVEGVYMLRPRLRHYWDASIWVETPRELRERRLYGRGENDPGWIERWMLAEDHYERIDQPWSAADLVLQGE